MFCFLFLCLFGPPPAPVVPDGQGGFVPFTNARVMPDGSLRTYDPMLDGVIGPDGRLYYFQPPPEPYPTPCGSKQIRHERAVLDLEAAVRHERDRMSAEHLENMRVILAEAAE